MKKSLIKYAYLSIIISLIVISLKIFAYFLTKSISFFSDALESFVNLSSAFFAYLMLKLAEKPEDENHPYGHNKAEYFSSIFEGILILIASSSIIFSAFQRLINPQQIENIVIGIFISISGALINFLAGRKLISAGRKNRSIALEADGQHLLTDAYTSLGVILAVFLVKITGFIALDPLVAIIIGLNILKTAVSLIKRSISGFLDEALEKKDIEKIKKIFKRYEKKGVKFHSIKSRQSAQKKFLSFHILLPNNWSIKKSHDLVYKIEKEIKKELGKIIIESHLEPLHDKKSFED